MFEEESALLESINPELLNSYSGDSISNGFIPSRLNLQWHITDRCNLKCTHCYIHDQPLNELSLGMLSNMLNSYVGTLKGMNLKGHIHVTGGEPFVRKDLFEFLELLKMQHEFCSFDILCNGTMLDDDSVKKLALLGCSFVQVSLDGGRDVHDLIRGDGSFERTLSGIKLLVKHGIPVSVSFTAGKNNYMEFGKAADAAWRSGAVSVWTDRVIPAGGLPGSTTDLMSDDEMIEYFVLVNRCRKKLQKKMFRKAGVSMGRALQFMYYDGNGFDEYPYRCSAGKTIITVLSDGRVVPCRRMPVIVGDFKTDDLYNIYHNSVLLRILRNQQNIPSGCGDCRYSQICNGGLKCLSYAVHGNPFIRDPQCTERLLDSRINKL